MSAEGVVSSTPSPRANVRLIAAVLLGTALGAAAALLFTEGAPHASRRRVVASAASPDKSRVAVALAVLPCRHGSCQELRIGSSEDRATVVGSLSARFCEQIVWTPDGTRVGFVVDGSEIELYDAQTLKLAGTVRLLTSEAARSRIARGITFSENGRAVTFDDCPRTHSGCRAGLMGIPQ